MRVTMTKTMPGSEDGIRVKEYVQDETYEMGDALAHAFIGSKCARPAAVPIDQTDRSKKRGKGPHENK